MSASQQPYAVHIPISPPPPVDLGTYARSMHQHTKKQMDAISSSQRRSRTVSGDSPPAILNGISPSSRSTSPSEFGYRT